MITLLYIPFCIFFAWLNAKWIAKGKRIRHGINGAIHIVAAAIIAWFTHWYHFFTVLLIARVSFDWPLNLFRGLPLGYVSINPKSIADRAEKKIFGQDGITPKILYALAVIVLLAI